MKKKGSILVLLLLCAFLCSCRDNAQTQETIAIPSEAPVTSEPPTTIPPTEETTPIEDSKDSSGWKIDYYVDDFGDPTNTAFISAFFSGTFSNTATTDSTLNVLVYHDPINLTKNDKSGYFAFRLLEYNDLKATYTSNDKAVLKIKIDDTIYEEELIGSAPNGDFYISKDLGNLSNASNDTRYGVYSPILSAFDDNKDIRCIIEVGMSKYNFTMNHSGFTEAVAQFNSIISE